MLALLYSVLSLTCKSVYEEYRSQSCCTQNTKDFELPPEWSPTPNTDYCTLQYDPAKLGQDSLDLVVVGSRSPLGFGSKAQTCMAVVAGDSWFLVDVGDGCARRLSDLGLTMDKFKGVLLTHAHSDHIADLGVLRMGWYTSVYFEKAEYFTVMGPQGIESVVQGMKNMYQEDTNFRFEHHATTLGANPQLAEVRVQTFDLPANPGAGKSIFAKDGLTITAFEVDHYPVKPAVGYRFDYMGRSLVINGDTIYKANFIPTIFNTDVLVADIMDHDLVEKTSKFVIPLRYGSWAADLFDDITTYHASIEKVVQQTIEANAKHLVLTHLVPDSAPFFNNDNLRARYIARIRELSSQVAQHTDFADEGRLISLPANSTDIVLTKGASPWDPKCMDVNTAFYAIGQPLIDDVPKQSFTFEEQPRFNTPSDGALPSTPVPLLPVTDVPPVGWAPDLRGMWKILGALTSYNDRTWDTTSGGPTNSVQLIEQAGLRCIVNTKKVIHDMYVDGTTENGVHDVMETDLKTPIKVAARYMMREVMPGIWRKTHSLFPKEPINVEDENFAVTRWIEEWDGKTYMLWKYPTQETMLKILSGQVEDMASLEFGIYIAEKVSPDL